MSMDPGPERTLGQLVASATQDISTLLRGEIALAKLEISGQVKKAGRGGILLAAAGVVAFYSVYFLFITIAEAIQALGLPRWLSFLIVTVVMLLVAGVLALLGIKKMKTVKPVPEKAVSQAQETIATLKAATSSPTQPLTAVSIDGSTRGSIPLGTEASARLDTGTRPDSAGRAAPVSPTTPAAHTAPAPAAHTPPAPAVRPAPAPSSPDPTVPDPTVPDPTRDSSRDA